MPVSNAVATQTPAAKDNPMQAFFMLPTLLVGSCLWQSEARRAALLRARRGVAVRNALSGSLASAAILAKREAQDNHGVP